MTPPPSPPANRAVIVLIDGARVDVLRDLLRRGDLPNLARWVIEPGGLRTGTTVFPSTTGVAYIPFLFGRYPGSLAIPGIRWLDRRGREGCRGVARAAGAVCARGRDRGRELPGSLVLSDHGRTVLRERTGPAGLLERDGVPTLRHPGHVWRRRARVATMVSGNASVQLYFDPRSGREHPLTASRIQTGILARVFALPAARLAGRRADSGRLLVRPP